MMVQTPLPIDPHLAEIVAHVRAHGSAVVVAPPGSGKTTRIPPALAEAIGRTILLQPRRVAARALARRIAQERGWRLGEEIGWQIRFERRFSERTRLLVATEGILTARLQSDPLLSDFDVVVLDEFHERSVHADVALALVRQAQIARNGLDRKSTRLNSSHANISTLSLHDALPISAGRFDSSGDSANARGCSWPPRGF